MKNSKSEKCRDLWCIHINSGVKKGYKQQVKITISTITIVKVFRNKLEAKKIERLSCIINAMPKPGQ